MGTCKDEQNTLSLQVPAVNDSFRGWRPEEVPSALRRASRREELARIKTLLFPAKKVQVQSTIGTGRKAINKVSERQN